MLPAISIVTRCKSKPGHQIHKAHQDGNPKQMQVLSKYLQITQFGVFSHYNRQNHVDKSHFQRRK